MIDRMEGGFTGVPSEHARKPPDNIELALAALLAEAALSDDRCDEGSTTLSLAAGRTVRLIGGRCMLLLVAGEGEADRLRSCSVSLGSSTIGCRYSNGSGSPKSFPACG